MLPNLSSSHKNPKEGPRDIFQAQFHHRDQYYQARDPVVGGNHLKLVCDC